MKEPIAIIPYDEVNFKFISNHWDVHLSGTCIYEGELCEFKNDYPNYNEETDVWDDMMVRIYRLSEYENKKWVANQKKFERCVGYHWSYDNGKRGKSFYYRKPEWFYKLLFRWFYWKKS